MATGQSHSIFISYSHHDQEFALRLKRSLTELGADVWMDTDILLGEDWSQAVEEQLKQRGLMVLILSPDAIESRHVTAEWHDFYDNNKPIIPVMWRQSKPSYQLHRVRYVPFCDVSYEAGLREVHAALRGHGFDLQPPPRETTVVGRDVPPIHEEQAEWPPREVPIEPRKGWQRRRDVPKVITGEHLGSYELRTSLATGSMSEICLAHVKRFDRLVAIKWLKPDLATDEVMRQRFRLFYEVNAGFRDPRVLPVYDYGVIARANLPFMVMAYKAGGSLADRLEQGWLSIAEASDLVTHVAAALDYASARGVLHGNLRPSHILLDNQGRAAVAELGFGAIFGDSMQVDPPVVYASPEQLRGQPLCAASDVYVLGLILFEALTGHKPYNLDALDEYRDSQLHAPLPPLAHFRPELKGRLQTVLETATRKYPAERYPSARAMAQAFHQALALR